MFKDPGDSSGEEKLAGIAGEYMRDRIYTLTAAIDILSSAVKRHTNAAATVATTVVGGSVNYGGMHDSQPAMQQPQTAAHTAIRAYESKPMQQFTAAAVAPVRLEYPGQVTTVEVDREQLPNETITPTVAASTPLQAAVPLQPDTMNPNVQWDTTDQEQFEEYSRQSVAAIHAAAEAQSKGETGASPS